MDLQNISVGYLDKFKEKKESPLQTVVNVYAQLKGMSPEERNKSYGRMASDAKLLLVACNYDLSVAMTELLAYADKAKKGGWNWNLRTLTKVK